MTKYNVKVYPRKGQEVDRLMRNIYEALGADISVMDEEKSCLAVTCNSELNRAELLSRLEIVDGVEEVLHIS